MTLLAALFLALAALVALLSSAVAADKDCGDLDTQAAAQESYLDAGGSQQDPHRLDARASGLVGRRP